MEVNDEIDFGQLIVDLYKQWKIILSITLIGTALVALVVFRMPKIYQQSAILTLPSEKNVEQVNSVGLIALNQKAMFKRYIDEVRSEENLRKFIEDNLYLPKLNPDITEQDQEIELVRLLSAFRYSILEPSPENRRLSDFVEYPTRVEIKLTHYNEPMLVDLMKTYIGHVNQLEVDALKEQSTSIKQSRQSDIEKNIRLLRQAAEFERGLQIERREKRNALEIEKLENESRLLLELEAKSRQMQIAKVNEAIEIAKNLGVETPTALDEISRNDSELSTKINLNQSQELPLYLMGTKYLNVLLDLLKKREDVKFVRRVAEIEKQIEELRLDPELVALRNRVSDDPYIEELPSLMSSLRALQSKTLDFEGVQLYSVAKQPIVTRLSIKPKRMMILLVAFVGFGIISLIVAMVRVSFMRRHLVY